MKSLLACSLMMLIAVIAFSHPGPQDADVRSAGIETSYDRTKDITTVRLMPVQISGEKDKYYSLHMSPSFNYAGQTFARPEFIDFELQTVVKGRLRTDLYVVFIVDGETTFLSSNRWGIKRPVPGRVWMGERLVFRMPYGMLRKLASSKRALVKLDAISFEFDDTHKKALREFIETVIHADPKGE